MVIALCAGLALAGSARAAAVEVDARLDRAVLSADRPETAVLKIGLFAPEGESRRPRRIPLSLALVVDRSGSMQGDKMHHARLAAREVIRTLGRNDWLALVAYDSDVSVLARSAPVVHPERLESLVAGLEAGGRTALYGGVACGAEEVEACDAPAAFRRVLLISDGMANVGPSSSGEIAALGRRLAARGVSISTVGLGLDYNEDLMTALARAGDGNTWFARDARALDDILRRELGDLCQLAARDVEVRIRLPEGVRAVRVPGREVDVSRREVALSYNQLVAGMERYVLVEVEVEPTGEGAVRELASVDVSWTDPDTGSPRNSQTAVTARFSRDEKKVSASTDASVVRAQAETLVAEARERAIALSDAGRPEAAAEELRQAGRTLGALNEPIKDEDVSRQSSDLAAAAKEVERDGLDNESRKAYRAENYKILNQHSR